MALRYVISAVVLAAVAGGSGYYLAKGDVISPAHAEAAETKAAAPAAEGRTPTASNPKVAEVGGELILKSDVEQLYNAIKQRAGNQAPPEDQVFWMLVDQIVASRLIIQAAQADKLQDTPDVQNAIRMASEQIVQEAYIQSLVKGVDKDSALKPLYDKMVESFKGQEEVKASHILVKDEAKAKDLLAQLNKGAKFEDLAKANSEDPGSKEQGGDLGFFPKEAMVPEFATVAFALGKGQTSQEPVKTQFGYHIIKVTDRRTRKPPTFEEAKPMLVQQAQQEKINEAINALRAKASIQKFAASGVPALPKEEAGAAQ